jgi:hypothetical protein
MNKSILICLLLILSNQISSAQTCDLKVSNFCKTALGKLLMTITFTNTNAQAVDRIDYEVTAYDDYGKKLGTETHYWQPTISSIKNGESNTESKICQYEGSKSIKVKVKKVHYVDGSYCD